MASAKVWAPPLAPIPLPIAVAVALLCPLAHGLAGAPAAPLPKAEEPPPLALVVHGAGAAGATGEKPARLDGAVLFGEAFIAAVPPERIRSAKFYLDDPERAAPPRVEEIPPFDFQGGSPGEPAPWDTRKVADGEHELRVDLVLASGERTTLRARFRVDNAGAPVRRLGTETIRFDFSPSAPGPRERAVRLAGPPGADFAIEEGLPAWLSAERRAGDAAGELAVRVDPAALGGSAASATIRLRSGDGKTEELRVVAAIHGEGTALARTVERHGFTWSFDDLYAVGRFVNGDPWVLGPVGIDSVAPGWNGASDGSMVNPRYSERQGYDSRFSFDPGKRADFPRTGSPGESIVSARSWRDDEPGVPSRENTLGIPRPALESAAVLTVLAEPPPEDSFRPPYAGPEKPLHRASALRADLLPSLPRVPAAPDAADFARRFERVWLDHGVKWKNRFLHPSRNMKDYARDFASEYNDGSLLLLLDLPAAEKRELMIRLVQIGIDMHAVIRLGAQWGDDTGGIGSGRKWPVLLAGILLDDPAMKSIGRDFGPEIALEDCQTFHLGEAEQPYYPGVPLGHPVWGERHCSHPGKYVDPGNTAYRRCCTANAWVGAVLSAHALGARELWDHEPLFDYQDWYMSSETPGTWERSWSRFAEEMWDAYRERYGPVWNGG